MKYSLVIFDFDGTLADTSELILESFRLTFHRLGLKDPGKEACRATIGIPLADAFHRLMPDMTDKDVDLCLQTYKHIFYEIKDNYPPLLFPGVTEALRKLYEAGVTLSIASSRSGESLRIFCEETGIDRYFSMMLGAEDVTCPKPDPMPVIITMENLNRTPQQTLVVGDMPVDILMGKRAGCNTLGVSYGNSSATDLRQAGADFISDNLDEATNILLNL